MLRMLKNKIAGMMMGSGLEAPLFFIGLALGIFLAVALNHWTGTNLCAMWPAKAAAQAVAPGV